MSKHGAAAEAAVEEAQAETEGTTDKAPKEPRRGIGTVVIEALRAGKTNEEALAAVKVEFPEANTTMASVNWYRNKLRTDGEDIPTARSLKAADRETVKAQKAADKAAEKEAKKATRQREKDAKKRTTTDSASADAEAEAGAGVGGGEGFLS